jgi:hypothetical protein
VLPADAAGDGSLGRLRLAGLLDKEHQDNDEGEDDQGPGAHDRRRRDLHTG